MPEANSQLVNAIRQGTFALVGSGLSRPAGAPSWTGLLWGIAHQVLESASPDDRKLIGRALELCESRPLDAARLLKEVAGADFHDTISAAMASENTLRPVEGGVQALLKGTRHPVFEGALRPTRRLVPTATHRTFVQLGFRVIVTTNFDNLLEDADPTRTLRKVIWNDVNLPRTLQSATRESPVLIKLHGELGVPDSSVLSRDQFVEAMASSQDKIKSLFPHSRPFIVGYGHGDPDLDPIFDRLSTHIGYTVHTRSQPEIRLRVRDLGGTSIELDDFDEVPGYIVKLARALNTPFVVRLLRGPGPKEGEFDRVAIDLRTPLHASFEWWRIAPDGALEIDARPDDEQKLYDAVQLGDRTVINLLHSYSVTEIDAGDRRYKVPSPARGGGVSSEGASGACESVFVPVPAEFLGPGKTAHFDFVSPQYLDLQNLCLDQPGFVYPSAADIEEHLITLLMIFPTVVINRAFLFQSWEIGEIFDRISDDDLRMMFDRGWFTLLSLVAGELSWDVLAEQFASLVEGSPDTVRMWGLFQRLRRLNAKIQYVSQSIPDLSPKFCARIEKIATSLVPERGHETLVPRMPFLSREERNAMSTTMVSVRKKLLAAVQRFTDPNDVDFPRSARKRLYSTHDLIVEFRNRPNILNVEQRLLKAAFDVSYATNAPSELGFSTTYAGYNTPFDLAVRERTSDSVEITVPRFHTLYLRVPYRLSDLLAVRPRYEFGVSDRRSDTPSDAQGAFRRWWNATTDRIDRTGRAPGLVNSKNLIEAEKSGLIFFRGETVHFSGVRVAPEVRRGALSEFSVLFAKPLDATVMSGRDFGAVLSETLHSSGVEIVN